MSTKITPVVNDYIHEHFAEWKIENFVYSKDAIEKTPVFSPIPQSDIKFHLELRFKSKHDMEFTLVKIAGTANNPSLKMKSDLRVIDLSGDCYEYYPPIPVINVSELSRFTFHWSDDILPCLLTPYPYSFIISCQMKFFEFSFTRPEICRKENWYPDTTVDNPSIIGDSELKVREELFPIHTAVLRNLAPVLWETICENNKSRSGIIVIEDASFSNVNVQCFLNYLYSGEIEDKCWGNVTTLYALAHKYEIGTLKRDCANILASTLNIESVCDVLKLAYDYDEDSLKQSATAFAANHVNELNKASWTEILLKYPMIGYDVMAISFGKK